MIAAAPARSPDAARRRVRRQLVLMVLIGLAPVVASYAIYYGWPRDRQVNYGTLIAAPSPAVTGRTLDGAPFALADLRGKWVMLAASGGGCDAACTRRLFAGRQARTIQNAERERIVRVWLVTDDVAPPAALLAEHDDLRVVRVPSRTAEALPDGGRALTLVDPLGNLVLAWPTDPDVKAVAKDIGRLLRASRIG